MHELGLAIEIHRLCRARLAEAGPARLERVRVAVGELSAVEPELLRFAWQAATADGPDAGAELEVEWRPARQTCEDCGASADRPEGRWHPACPRCGGRLGIQGGFELDLLEFRWQPLATPIREEP